MPGHPPGEDPSEPMRVQGRGREAVVAGPRTPHPARAADPGVVARDAYAARRPDAGTVAPLPRAPLPTSEPGRPAPLVTDAPPGAPTSAAELTALATDATRRAWDLATGQGDGELGLSVEADLARRAHAALGTPRLAELARRSQWSDRQLIRLATVWGHGGADALTVLDETWQRPNEIVDEARQLLVPAVARVRRSGDDHLSLPGGVQLRVSRAGRWYPCERRDGDWEVIGPGDRDPVGAYDTRM